MAQLKPGTTIGGRNIVQELDSHKNDKVAHIDYAVASGTNTYTANIQGITSLVEGLSVKIKFQNANTGASTLNINGLGAKEIRKSNGNTLSSGNIKAGQICHLVYTGSVFQLLGEGGEYGTATPAEVLKGYTIGTENGIVEGTLELTGNATPADVLAGKTFYSTNAKSKQAGTMPNNGSQSATLTITGSGKPTKTIPAGYTTGGTITAQVNSNQAPYIKNGYNLGGCIGTYDANGVKIDRTDFQSSITDSYKYVVREDGYLWMAYPRLENGEYRVYTYKYTLTGTLISSTYFVAGSGGGSSLNTTHLTVDPEYITWFDNGNDESKRAVWDWNGTKLMVFTGLSNQAWNQNAHAGCGISLNMYYSNNSYALKNSGGTVLRTVTISNPDKSVARMVSIAKDAFLIMHTHHLCLYEGSTPNVIFEINKEFGYLDYVKLLLKFVGVIWRKDVV